MGSKNYSWVAHFLWGLQGCSHINPANAFAPHLCMERLSRSTVDLHCSISYPHRNSPDFQIFFELKNLFRRKLVTPSCFLWNCTECKVLVQGLHNTLARDPLNQNWESNSLQVDWKLHWLDEGLDLPVYICLIRTSDFFWLPLSFTEIYVHFFPLIFFK